MRHLYKSLILFIVSFLITLPSAGQLNFKFRTMSPKGGLFYDGITKVLQDSSGYIWVIVGDELLRFDGYEYFKYGELISSKTNNLRWKLYDITVSNIGELLVSTNNGIYKYRAINNSFKKTSITNDLSSFKAIELYDNYYWTISNNRLFKSSNEFETKEAVLYNNKEVLNISKIITTENCSFFSTYYNRIYFNNNPHNNTIELLYEFKSGDYILDITQRGGNLWALVKDKGIYCFDIKSKKLKQIIDPYKYAPEFKSYEKCLYVDKYNKIWLGTQQGLLIIDPSLEVGTKFYHSDSNPFSLPNNSIWTIIEDQQQNVWLGTFLGGLCYVNIDEKEWFKTYNTNNSALTSNMISCFAEDQNSFWIGTEGAGLNQLDKKTNRIKQYKHSPSNPHGLPYNNIKSLALTPNGNLWIAMFKGGLAEYAISENRFYHYNRDKDSRYQLLSNDLRKIISDGKDGIWISYQMTRIAVSYISLKTQTIRHFYYPEDSKTTDRYIFDITLSKDGTPYFITRESVYHIGKDSDKIEELKISTDNKFLNAQSCLIDEDNIMWLGTAYNGLYKAILENDTLEFNLVDSSKDYTTILSLCRDNHGDIWFGTDNGLYKFSESLYAYDASEGFQGQVYYPLASFKSKYDEFIYFGGTNGYTKFNPSIISSNSNIPKPMISDIIIDGIPYNNNYSEDITIDYKSKNFGFKISSNNYLIPAKNKFKYRLKGYDNNWTTIDANSRFVQFTKIPSGTYSIEVLTANNDGLWSKAPITLKVYKQASPLLRWPAFIAYALVIFLLLGSIIYYLHEKRKLKMQLYLDQVERDKQKELYNSQLQFFTNISHDFRTPLSLILGVIDNLKQQGVKEYYYDILKNNGNRLLHLVNELMDFRKVESGNLQYLPQPNKINDIIKTIATDFENAFSKKSIKMNMDFVDTFDSISLMVDKNIIEKIALNLINNALKYTQRGFVRIGTLGKNIQFNSCYESSYQVGDIKDNDYFSIIIQDSGVGISKSSISTVFDRFYQVNYTRDTHLGTGVGLALVKSLVLLHEGEIRIYSERNKGTDFIIKLPYKISQEANNEIKTDDSDINNFDDIIYDSTFTEKVSSQMVLFNEKKRVLIVEDNRYLRTLLADYLTPYYAIFTLKDAIEVDAFLEKQDIDLIISDIMMPIKDGVTLCRELKNNLETSHIPFILLTAKTEIESKIDGIGSGADLYLEKPVDFSLLLTSINNIFKQQEKLREYYAKNYFAEDVDLSINKQENEFLKKLISIIDSNLDNSSNLEVNFISSELGMSRSKLYSKLKTLTGKSIVEFILEYKLRKAAKIMIEKDLSIIEVMETIGIKSQSYFTTAFKKEFGDTPAAFIIKHKKGVD